jgi:hypothetical protein
MEPDMKTHDPLEQIMARTRPHWDQANTRPEVRCAFNRTLQCRTLELGAEVFASGNEELIVPHTCKSRSCSSCGYRATAQWQRERWIALPDTLYKGITFTMPDVLWSFFRENRPLAKALPTLAAKIIQVQMSARYGVRVGIIAILHTFNGKLEFNSHVHTMVTGGGLCGASNTWIACVYYDRSRLMESWRKSVIALLRAAHEAGHLQTAMTFEQTEELLTQQEHRWWSVKIQTFKSKGHFLKYAGRYLRRPPIAQRRITHIGKRMVTFWAKDKKRDRRVRVKCSLEEFIDRWAQHIPEHYQHSVRTFGLFAPRAVGKVSKAIFAILGQEQKPRPKPRRWADSIKRDFGHDPLLDSAGKRMKWVRRIPSKTTQNPRGRYERTVRDRPY